MTLAGHVRVENNSGEDYDNAQVRLVVGVVRLVEGIAVLASRCEPFPEDARLTFKMKEEGKAVLGVMAADGVGDKPDIAAPVVMVKEGLSEYFLYTVGGRNTVPTGWAKRLPSFRVADVPIISYYKVETERWADQVIRHYKFKNDKASQLGAEPLPDGEVRAVRQVSPDSLLAFTGTTQVKYIPVGEEVELELGNDREVLVKPKLMNWVKEDVRFDQRGNVAGWTTRESWEIELQNSKDIPVTLDIRRSFAGDWELKTDSAHEKVDATKVKFVRPLTPRAKQTISYELITRHGTNATH